MKRMIVIAILLTSTTASIQAQIDTMWVRTYNGSGNGNDVGKGCIVGLDNSIYVTGLGFSDDNNYLTIKYDTNGNIIWDKFFNGPSSAYDEANACAIDNNNDLYVTGGSVCPPSLHSGRLTIKYSGVNGDTIWTRLFDTSGGNDGYDVAVDDSGNVVTTGKTTINTHNNYLTIKYDQAGQEVWSNIYTSNYNIDEEGKGCAVDNTGKIYVTGNSSNAVDKDIFTIKYDNNGDTLWTRRYDKGLNEYGVDCVVDDSGYVYVAGYYADSSYIAIKYNTNGDTIWSRVYSCTVDSPSASLQATSCAIDKSNHLYVSGYDAWNKIITHKIDCTTGDSLTTVFYPGSGNTVQGFSCAVDDIGHLFVVGSKQADFLTVKFTLNVLTPILIAPLNSASLTINTPLFIWNTIDSASTYRLQISPFSNFASLTYNQATAETTLTSTALPDNWYYWRVKAYSATDSSDWSEVRSFSVATSTVAAPALTFPPADTATNDSFPDFDWEDVAGASQYQLQVGKGNKWLWAADYYNGIHVYNASDPSAIHYIHGASLYNVQRLVLRDSILFACHYNQVYVTKVTNPYTVNHRSSYGCNNNGAAVRDTVLYVASTSRGLRLVNVADPDSVFEIAAIDTTVQVRDVKVAGDRAYMLANGYLKVVDVSNPAAPAILGSLPMANAQSLDVAGNYAYTASGSSGLQVVDVSNPA
ncbi:hypothetical protein EG834_02100, partial [bacterium]|nr:hypothetical protein [bacterium]